MQIAKFEYSINFSGDIWKKQTMNWLDGIESVKILKAWEGVVKFIKDFIITKKRSSNKVAWEQRSKYDSFEHHGIIYTVYVRMTLKF